MNLTYPDKCPLCGAVKIAPNFYACFEGENPCDLDLIDQEVMGLGKRQKNLEAFKASLPERYRQYLAAPLPEEASELNPEAREKLSRMTRKGFLYIAGKADAAKTHIAVQQAVKLSENGKYTVMFVDETEYFAQVFAEFNGKGEAPDLIAPDILVYDDLGKQKATEFAAQRLYHLLEMRWAHEKGLIITSNFSPNEVAARLSSDIIVASAVQSRLTAGQVVGFRRGKGGRVGSAV